MLRCRQQVRNKLATSRCNGIWETTRHNRLCCVLSFPKFHYNVEQTQRTFCPRQLVTDLWTCVVETGVMDFCLNRTSQFANHVLDHKPAWLCIDTPRCDYVYKAEVQRSGAFQSPDYPESYPNSLTCRFRFIGESADRVQLRFTHFNLRYHHDDADDPFA